MYVRSLKMGKTSIEWTDEVWNPVTGCQKVSQGCKNCYAERIASRFWGERKFTDVVCHDDRMDIPLSWKKPRRVFVNSMSDLFHVDVDFKFIRRVWRRMADANQHTFLILTKRPERMLEFTRWMAGDDDLSIAEWPRNVWLGVSVEDQKAADERIPYLLKTPAAVRFLSCEPLLGSIRFANVPGLNRIGNGPGLDWVIAGGESGPGARPMHPEWAKSLKDQCQAANVPFFFKQWGEWVDQERANMLAHNLGELMRWRTGVFDRTLFSRVGKKAAGRLLDGREWNEFPER
jgi:protein gp37